MPPTTLITEGEFRTAFNIAEEVASAQLSRPLAAAARRLKSWVTAEAYADAVLDDAAVDQDRRHELDYAEVLLAMHFAILGLNTQITPDGVVKAAKDEGNTVLQYMNPKETNELRESFLEQALGIIEPYRVPKENAGAGSSSSKPTFFGAASGRRGL